MAKQGLAAKPKFKAAHLKDICTPERSYTPWNFVDRRRRALEQAHHLDKVLRTHIPSRNSPVQDVEFNQRRGLRVLTLSLEDSVTNQLIEREIEDSRYILDLGDNWDEEGSPGYQKETWERATRFIRRVALSFKNEVGRWVTAPEITPGPNGSIDVRWRSDNRSLLINFPANESIPPDFFGNDNGVETVKGTLNLSSQNQWLLMWLTR